MDDAALKSSTRKSIHGWSVPDWDDVTFAGLGFLSRMTRSCRHCVHGCRCHCRDRIYPRNCAPGLQGTRGLYFILVTVI